MGAALSFAEYRRRGMGGSDQAPRLGLSPFTTPAQLQAQKLGLVEDDQSEAMWLGQVMEDPLAERFAKQTGLKLRRANKTRWHRKWTHCMAHPDRVVQGAREGVEIKLTSWKEDEWGEPGTAEVPDYYLAQAHHYLEVCDYERWHVYVYFLSGRRGAHYVVERDRDLGQAMVAGAHEWYAAHVIRKEPVEPTNLADLRLLYARSNGSMIEADSELVSLLQKLATLRIEIQAREIATDDLKFAIQQRLGEHDGALYGGKPIVTWKSSERHDVDVKRLREERPEVASLFGRVTQTRTFLPKWNKIEELI